MLLQELPKNGHAALMARMRPMRLECSTCGCHTVSPTGAMPPLACGNCGQMTLRAIREIPRPAKPAHLSRA